ncbi:hypothetical protein [Paralimibaculum aggregatum]|nr:hypothetical protein [Limibaculum sp. NKW23]
MMREDGAVSVEWVAATAALIVVSSFMGYYLFFGINEIREENNTDFNRVQTGESAGGGGIE